MGFIFDLGTVEAIGYAYSSSRRGVWFRPWSPSAVRFGRLWLLAAGVSCQANDFGKDRPTGYTWDLRLEYSTGFHQADE